MYIADRHLKIDRINFTVQLYIKVNINLLVYNRGGDFDQTEHQRDNR